jgi:propionyl-CoA synthetase
MGIEHLPVKAGSVGPAAPGWDVHALDSEGNDVAAGDVGAIACKLPLPPGTLTGLWQAEERFRSSYLKTFPGYYETGDAGFVDEDGYIHVMSRTDDVINVAGHRLSTGAIEEVLAGHRDVAECAVIGAADDLKGQLPLGFLVLKAGVDRPHETIVAETVAMVREQVGPVAVFKKAVVVTRLPKTRSGKVLRGTMRNIADSQEYKVPATIEDPVVLDEIETALHTIGYSD